MHKVRPLTVTGGLINYISKLNMCVQNDSLFVFTKIIININ